MKKKEISNDSQRASDFSAAALHVFGKEAKQTLLAADYDVSARTVLQNADVWVHQCTEQAEPSVRSSFEDTRNGRIGKWQVKLDRTTQTGPLTLSQDLLHARGQSDFCAILANTCVFAGKWQYEVQLGSRGVMQVGWSKTDQQFSTVAGVGDTQFSFAFDGNRRKKWNMVASEYGEAWQVGDVIGCLLDLDHGCVTFYRNGKDLGEAFSGIVIGAGDAYYPAVSLGFDEKLLFNFGAVPFKYPVDTFEPVQKSPSGHLLRARQLLRWIDRIAGLPAPKYCKKETVALLLTEVVTRHLAGFLSVPYVLEACLVPFFLDITFNCQPSPRNLAKFNFVCDSLVFFIQREDVRELFSAVCQCLLHKFAQTPLTLDYHPQKSSLAMLADICQNHNARRTLLSQLMFVKTRVPEFMDVKIIDLLELKRTVTQPWWPLHQPEDKAKRESYLRDCHTIQSRVQDVETLQESILLLLLDNSDSSTTQPSSRKLFLNFFREFLKHNHINGLNEQAVDQTPLPIALSYCHRLLEVVRTLWQRELPGQPVYVPVSQFYAGQVDYFSIERLGGVLSHLVRTFHEPLATQLGEDHRVFTEQQTPSVPATSVQVQVRAWGSGTVSRWYNVNMSADQRPEPTPTAESVAPGAAQTAESLAELLDGVILLYNVAAHKQLYKISTLRDEMDKYVNTLNEANKRLWLSREDSAEARELKTSIATLERKVEEQSRMMAWVRGAVFTAEKRTDLVWLLKAVLRTLEQASRHGQLFAFVPDFYLDAAVELCAALRCYFSPTLPIEELPGYKKLFVRLAEFLVEHFNDPRIVTLGSKDTITEALAAFIAKQPTLSCLESVSQHSQERLVEQLLRPYDNRPWGQTNWMLMRLWQGCGLGFRYKQSPHLTTRLTPRTPTSESSLLIHQAFEPCPSPQYQRLVAKTLMEKTETAAEFLNSLLKQLNWAFSEFISMMQEIQNLSKRPDRVIIDAKQLKICATCFDFVVSLLRVLEMVCTTCLPVFTDPSRDGSENLLERLCQLLSQILLRASTPKGCFNHVISLEVPDLDSIHQFPVLSAVAGVLAALLVDDLTTTRVSLPESPAMSVAAKTLLSEPAFQVDSLRYLLGETDDSTGHVFSLANYPESVSEVELSVVRCLVSVLTHYKTLSSASADTESDEGVCLICYANPLAVTFHPCHHQSCKSCITHHLMDCKECFFCKAAIKKVELLNGKLLWDSTTSVHRPVDPQLPL